MKRIIKLIYIFLLICIALPLTAGRTNRDFQPRLHIRDSRILAMGDTFTAIADDRYALFYNPAGLAFWGRKKMDMAKAVFDPSEWKPSFNNIGDINLFSMNIGVPNPISFYQDTIDDILLIQSMGLLGGEPEDFNDQIDTLNTFIDLYNTYYIWRKNFDLLEAPTVDTNHWGFGNLTYTQLSNLAAAAQRLAGQSFSLSYDLSLLSMVRHHVGFGLFNSMDFSAVFDVQGFLPDLDIKFQNDLVFAAGFGMPWPTLKRLGIGVTAKYFHRFWTETDRLEDFLEIAEFSETLISSENIGDMINYQKNMLRLLTQGPDIGIEYPDSLSTGTGLGFDLGFMYRLKQNVSLGLQISDVYTRINWWDQVYDEETGLWKDRRPGIIPVNMRAGISWKPRFSIPLIFHDPVLAFDLDDLFFRDSNSIWLKMHAGMEWTALMRFLRFRIGMNQGYFSINTGIVISPYFLSKIPLLGWLRPDAVYFPQFNPNKKDFLRHNPCCCCMSSLLWPLFYAHIKIDLTYYSRELGDYPGAIQDQRLVAQLSFSWYY